MTSLNDLMRARILEGAAVRRERRDARPKGLVREYDCVGREHVRALVGELLEMQDRLHHSARVVVEGCRVTLETWTPNQGVTELDEEYCAEADVVFEDTRGWR